MVGSVVGVGRVVGIILVGVGETETGEVIDGLFFEQEAKRKIENNNSIFLVDIAFGLEVE